MKFHIWYMCKSEFNDGIIGRKKIQYAVFTISIVLGVDAYCVSYLSLSFVVSVLQATRQKQKG